jgi:hypothetical protein
VLVSDHPRALRPIVILALTLATAGIYAVSMRANYLYGASIGQSPETRFAIAWANVAADVWKGFGLVAVVALWRATWRRAALAMCLTWLVCLSFSVSSAVGIYVQERTTLTSGREAKHASYADAKKQLTQLEYKIRSLGSVGVAGQLEAAIDAVFARTVMSGDRVRGTVGTLSANCSKLDARTAADCTEVAELRRELAVAHEAARLEGEIATLRQRVATLRRSGNGSAPDPVGEFWAWMTRGWLSVKDVAFGLPLFFAVMVEMVSAFGPVGIAAYAEATRPGATRPAMARPGATEPAAADSGALHRDIDTWKDVGLVVQYMAERTEPRATGVALGAGELYRDYRAWCRSAMLNALPEERFLQEFDRVRASPQLAGKIKKFGNRYYGIQLVSSVALADDAP